MAQFSFPYSETRFNPVLTPTKLAPSTQMSASCAYPRFPWQITALVNDQFRRLRMLAVPNSPDITDRGVAAIGMHCPNLTELSLAHCPNVSDIGLAAIGRGCQQLTRIDLSGERAASIAALVAIACTHEAVRERLRARTRVGPQLLTPRTACRQVTDAGVGAVADGCRMLSTVNLSRCRQLSDESLVLLGRFCMLLQSLNVSWCRAITDRGLVAMGLAVPHLKVGEQMPLASIP